MHIHDYERDMLQFELESFCHILSDKAEEAEKELDAAIGDDISEKKFHYWLGIKSMRDSKLRGFCRAMEIIEDRLEIELDIPIRSMLSKK